MCKELFMQRALDLALKGEGATSPNPKVGAVIVKNKVIIAEGWHRRFGGDHAEIVALKKASLNAKGAAIYIGLEPCYHQGKTPPCVDAIIRSGIKEVVIAIKDPNPLTGGKSIQKLRRGDIKVNVGVLGNEASKLNEVFIKYITKKMPFVVAKTAQTLDGKIATATGDSKWITSKATREYARKIRGNFDAIMVGIETVLGDNPRLNPVKIKKDFKKIVVDSRCRVPLNAKLFSGFDRQNCIIATTKKAKRKDINALENKGVKVIVCPEKGRKVDLKWLLKNLAKSEITSILLEGGAQLIGSALKEKLVDKCHIYSSFKILGDQKGLSSVVGLKVNKISDCIQLNHIKILQLSDDLLIEGYPQKKRK